MPLDPQVRIEYEKAVHAGGDQALRAAITLNGGAILALMAFFAGKEVGPPLRLALLDPLCVFAGGAALTLLSYGARFYSDFLRLGRIWQEDDLYARSSWANRWIFRFSHTSGIAGGLAFVIGVFWMISVFANPVLWSAAAP